MSFLVKVLTQTFPSFFSNRLSTFDKNVNLSKINPETEEFFLVFPSLNTSIFYDVSQNSEHIKTFSKGLTQKSILEMEKFSNFLHNDEQIFLPEQLSEKDNLIKNLFKSF